MKNPTRLVVNNTLLLLLCIIGFVPTISFSDDKRWYLVELVVFEQGPSSNWNSPYADPGTPNTEGALWISSASKNTNGNLSTTQNQFENDIDIPLLKRDIGPMELLPDTFLSLHGIHNKLKKQRAYRVIDHIAWYQQEYAFGNAHSVHIGLGKDFSDHQQTPGTWDYASPERNVDTRTRKYEIDGTVAFTRGTYMHLNLDLIFRESRPYRKNELPFIMRKQLQVRNHRLIERRRIQTAQLNYFDHSKFAVIANVTRFTPPEMTISYNNLGNN